MFEKMELYRCFKCGKTSEEVKIFDGISINEAVRTCEKCALLDGVPLLKNPSTDQLKSSEKSDMVYKRLKKISGIRDESPKKSIFEELKEIDQKSRVDFSKIEEKPSLYIENFHWIIQKQRRNKGLTTKQLAAQIGESEMALKLIERNNLPENSLPLIRKLEQFFQIKLHKDTPSFSNKPIDEKLDGRGTTVEIVRDSESQEIPEPHLIKKTEPEPVDKEPIQVLSFKKEKIDSVTIADLREAQRMVEQDFPKKTSTEIGREQLDDFGKTEKTQVPFSMKSWSESYFKKRKEKQQGGPVGSLNSGSSGGDKVPSLAELAERQKERQRQENSIIGDEIELADEGKGEVKEQKPEEKKEPIDLGDDIEIIEAEDL
jgi:ribosome-binding protein aMBF1 (putative translation factor)